MKDQKDFESFEESKRVPETFNFPESENQKGLLNEDFVFNFEDNVKQAGTDSNTFDLGVEENKTKPAQDDYTDEIKKAAQESAEGSGEASSTSSSSVSASSSSSGASAASTSGAAAGASSGVAAVAATATTAVVLVVGGGIALSNQVLRKPTVCQFNMIEVADNSVSYSLFLGADNSEGESISMEDCNVFVELLLPGESKPVQEKQIFTFGTIEDSFTGLAYDTEYLLRLSQHVLFENQDGVLPDDYQKLIDELDLFKREYLTFSFGDDTNAEYYRFRTPADKKYYKVTWLNYDDTVLEVDENVLEGTMPSYDGNTPTKAKDNNYIYSFNGWTPKISEVKEDVTYKATFKEETRYAFNVSKVVDPLGGETYSIEVSRNTKEPQPSYSSYMIGVAPATEIQGADGDEPYQPVQEWHYMADYDLSSGGKQSLFFGGSQLNETKYVFGLIGRDDQTEEEIAIYSTIIESSSFISSDAPSDAIYFQRVMNSNSGLSTYYAYYSYSGSETLTNINGVLSNPEDATGGVVSEFGLSYANQKEEVSLYFGNNNEYIPYDVLVEASTESDRISFTQRVDFGNIPTLYVDEPVFNGATLGIVRSYSEKYAAVTIDMEILDYTGLWKNDSYTVTLTNGLSGSDEKTFNSAVNKMSFGIKDTLCLTDISTEDVQNYLIGNEYVYYVYHEGDLVYGPENARFIEKDPTNLDGSFNLYYASVSQTVQDEQPIAFEIYCDSNTDTSEFTRFEIEFENTTTSETFTESVKALNKAQKTSITIDDLDRNAPNYLVSIIGIRSDGTSKVIYQEEVDLIDLPTQEWTEPEFFGASFNFEKSQSGIADFFLVDLNYSDPTESWSDDISGFSITITNNNDSTESYTSIVSTFPYRNDTQYYTPRYFLPQFNASVFREYLLDQTKSYSYSVSYNNELVSDGNLPIDPSDVTSSIADASVAFEWTQSMTSGDYVLKATSTLDTSQDYYGPIMRIMLVLEETETHFNQKYELWFSGDSETCEKEISEITQAAYGNSEFTLEVRAYYDQSMDEEYLDDEANYTIMYGETINLSNI